ncbi:hypothetical protein [Actinokineospora sp. HUAS TT18]|uniref:hypothetical protein n=1 Tax=Actinokineospora sp. HUAS TT18 TaxID=3447451 RepID=UPI003F520308
MTSQTFAAVGFRRATGMTVYGPFTDYADAVVVADRCGDAADSYALPIVLCPPEIDKIAARSVDAAAGTVLYLDNDIAAALSAGDPDPAPDVPETVVVSVLTNPPTKPLMRWVGPFADTDEARTWLDQATTRKTATLATTHIHPLRGHDTLEPTPKPPGDQNAADAAHRNSFVSCG